MKENRQTNLRQRLAQLPSDQLDEMLQQELQQEAIDDEQVRLILSVLKDRESREPAQVTPEIEAAWEKYQKNMGRPVLEPVPLRKKNSFLRVAAVLAVVLLLLAAVPQKVEAENFFERLIRWTDSIFELLSPGDSGEKTAEYVFETDHPGLQQVYDAVVELGVTEPVVPMWLPDGYELTDYKVIDMPTYKSISAEFSDGENNICYYVDIYAEKVSYEYYKDETQINSLEIAGVVHNVMRNNDVWTVVWVRDNLECAIAIDCQEDVINQILWSIYTMEDE